MQTWHLWIIVGIVLSILEIFTSGFLVINFGIAAIITGLVAWAGVGFKVQVFTFAISSLILFALSRKLATKYLNKDKPEARTNVDALKDQSGIVTERIPGGLDRGQVKIGGEEWSAISEDNVEIPAGDKVVIVRVEGNKLVVKKEA